MFCTLNVHFLPTTVSNDALRGATPQAAAQVLQWVSFADSEIIPPASAWVFPTLGIMQFNKQVCSSEFPDQAKDLNDYFVAVVESGCQLAIVHHPVVI